MSKIESPCRRRAVLSCSALTWARSIRMRVAARAGWLAWSLCAAVMALSSAACNFPNPKDCEDGTCTDPARPFCDTDGALSGFNQTCIAAACTPTEFAACRGDQAVMCNTDGTNYDVVGCALGCDAAAGGCRECTANSQCGESTPVCDPETSACRVCRHDDECASRVCDVDLGVCILESAVVYSSPTGFNTSCTKDEPCALPDALAAALNRPGRPIVRMLPGTYRQSLEVAVGTVAPIEVVATQATVSVDAPASAISVRNEGNLKVRGLSVVAIRPVTCGDTTSVSSLVIRDSSFFVLGNSSAIDVTRCGLQLHSTELNLNGSEIAITMMDQSSLRGDRLHIHGSTSHYITAFDTRVTLKLTNSLLEDVGLVMNTKDTTLPGSQILFASDTFVFSNNYALPQGCDGSSPYVHVAYENTIIAPLKQFDAVHGTNCSFYNVLLSHQTTPVPGATVADPLFVDPSMRDFHLKATSPAIDAAQPSRLGLDSAVDLDGVSRTKGDKPDIGAYERTP